MRNVSAEHANRWEEEAFVLHVSYIPVKKIKAAEDGEGRAACKPVLYMR